MIYLTNHVFLGSISLTQFKNYHFFTFDFTERVIGICGLNGKGKTNLPDAAYYCCFTKSYFTKIGAVAEGKAELNSVSTEREMKLSVFSWCGVEKA